MKRNRRYIDSVLGQRLSIDPTLPEELVGLLTEAETSGGLLFGVAPGRAGEVAGAFAAQGETCAEIGEVTAERTVTVLA
jgi:selenophosphate synthase